MFSRYVSKKLCFCRKKCGFLDFFLGTNVTTLRSGLSKLLSKQIKYIDNDVCFFQRKITYANHVCPQRTAFSISLLVCEFNSHRQTLHQKFIGTYPPLGMEIGAKWSIHRNVRCLEKWNINVKHFETAVCQRDWSRFTLTENVCKT